MPRSTTATSASSCIAGSGTGAWEECAAPAYPPQPEGQTDTDPMGRTIPWTTVKLWALEPGGADQPGLLWCGTLPGGLFRSRDRGTSWELIRPLWDNPKRKEWMGGGYDVPGIHSICVDPRNSRVVRAAVSVGGIWTTRDGGETWSCDYEGMRAAYMPPEKMYDPNSQDAHRLVQCAGAPDALWVQHHNGIFHSTDGGSRWRECKDVPPSELRLRGRRASARRQDGVVRAGHQGRAPHPGRRQVRRHAHARRRRDLRDAVAAACRSSTPTTSSTGIAWRWTAPASSSPSARPPAACGSVGDQGDSWTAISHHLPPIHCVRFVA